MNCQRCTTLRNDPAVARIRTEIMDLRVCARCAEEAAVLGLHCEAIAELDHLEFRPRLASAA
jgi:hypothetical protein